MHQNLTTVWRNSALTGAGQDSRGRDSAVDVTEARARELHMKKQERDSNGSFNCHIEAMPGEQHRFVELLSHGLVDKRY